jgi:hypothetical protein
LGRLGRLLGNLGKLGKLGKLGRLGRLGKLGKLSKLVTETCNFIARCGVAAIKSRCPDKDVYTFEVCLPMRTGLRVDGSGPKLMVGESMVGMAPVLKLSVPRGLETLGSGEN